MQHYRYQQPRVPSYDLCVEVRVNSIPTAYARPASPSVPTDALAPDDTISLGNNSEEGGFFRRLGRGLGFGKKKPQFFPLRAAQRNTGFYKLSPALTQLVARDDARTPQWLSQRDWRIADTGRVVHDDNNTRKALSTELRTPIIALGQVQEATLETDFQYGRLESIAADELHFEVRRPGGEWKSILARQADDGQKVKLSYDLSEYVGDAVEFRFRLETQPDLRFPFLGIDRFTVRGDDQVLFRSGRADLKQLPRDNLDALERNFEALGDLHEAGQLVAELGNHVKPCHLEAVRRYGPDVCEGLAQLAEPEVSVHSMGVVTRVERRLPEPPSAEERSAVRTWLAGACNGRADEALTQLKNASVRIDPPRFWRLLTHLSSKTEPIQWSQFPAMVDSMLMGDERSVDSVMLRDQQINFEEDFLLVGDVPVERKH